MRREWHVLLNPTAARGKAGRQWPGIAHQLASMGVAHNFTPAESLDQMSLQVAKAKSQGYHRFLVVGGDGTLHHALNAILPWDGPGKPTIALIPFGTGNDWAKAYGIPKNTRRAVRVVSESRSHTQGVGRIVFDGGANHYFINVAGMALDATVVERVAANPRSRLGAAAYLLEGVRTLFHFTPPELSIEADGRREEGKWMTVHAGIGKFCGGGMSFTPHGGGPGTELAIAGIRQTSRLRLIANIYRLYTGTILGFSRVVALTTSLVYIAEGPGQSLSVEADGEYLGCGSVTIEAIPDAIEVVGLVKN